MDCPTCGSPVTLAFGSERPLSTSVPEAILTADEDEGIEISRDCWDCGWQETRRIRVESISLTEGDERSVERAALIDEIVTEVATIDRLATLEDALAEIRRQRRRDSTTTETDTPSE